MIIIGYIRFVNGNNVHIKSKLNYIINNETLEKERKIEALFPATLGSFLRQPAVR